MTAGIGEQRDHVEVFAKGPGPAVREQQRQRALPLPAQMKQMDTLTVEVGHLMRPAVQTVFEAGDVEGLPVAEQFFQPPPWHA